MPFEKHIPEKLFKRCKHPKEKVEDLGYVAWCTYCGSRKIDTVELYGGVGNWRAPEEYLKKVKGTLLAKQEQHAGLHKD